MKRAEMRAFEICMKKKLNPDISLDDLASQYQVTVGTVKNALSRGEGSGYFIQDNSELLARRIAEIRNELEELQELQAMSIDTARRILKGDVDDSKAQVRLLRQYDMRADVIPLDKLIQSRHILLLELEGLYNKNVNIQINNNKMMNIVILPEKIGTDGWDKAVDRMIGEKSLGSSVVPLIAPPMVNLP